MAAPTFGTAGTYLAGAAGTTAPIAVPTGVANLDVILVHLYLESTAAVTPPTGFTELTPFPSATGSGGHTLRIFWKRATGADTGTYSFALGGNFYRDGVATRYPGCATTGSPMDVFTSAARSSNGTVTPAVSSTTTGVERLLVWTGSNYFGGSWTPPSGYTERVDNGAAGAVSVATLAQASAGATGSVTGTCTASNYETAWLVALLPAVPAQTVTTTTVPAPAAPPNPTVDATPRITPAIVPAPALPNPVVVPGTVNVAPVRVAAPAAPPGPRLDLQIRAAAIPAPPAPPAPVITQTARPPMRVDFWALDDDLSILCPLPDATSWDLSLIPGEPGAVRLDYPVDGINYDILRDRVTRYRDLYVQIRTDGTTTHALGALMKARDGDEIAETGKVSFVGAFLTALLAEGVLPYNVADVNKKGETTFAAASAGGILNFALTAAKAAGDIPDLHWSFTALVDSNGVPWPTGMRVSPTFSPGKTLLELAQQLRAWGLAEFEVTSTFEVRLYVPDSVGIDHTLSDPPLVLRAGRDLLEAPRRIDTGDSYTDLIVAGGDGVYVRVFDATARARRGRVVTKFISEGSLKTVSDATAYAQTALQLLINGVDEFTHTLTFDQNLPTPLKELFPSDWVYSDTGDGLSAEARMRIVQLTVSQTEGQDHYSGGVVLGDLIADRDVALQRQLDRLKSGSTVVGTSQPPPTDDTSTPAAPAGVIADSVAYKDGSDTLATLLVGWAAVTFNADGTAATDIAGYRVQWRPAAGSTDSWTQGADTPSTSTSFGGVSAGVEVRVRVAAYDRTGHQSAWSTEVGLITQNDTTAPPTPSTPAVSNYLGVLLVAWDGLGSAGETMPSDFDYVEIHQSASASFTPTTATYVDRLYGKGEYPVADQPYGVTQYFLLVALDNITPTPNRSGPSGIASGIAEQVVGQDVFDGAVGSAKLADLAVITAKMDNLAVNDAKFGSGSVGKLTAGVFTAAMTISGIIRTSATGARAEIDAAGIRLYSGGGTVTVNLKATDGSALITGQIQTAVSGARIVMNTSNTNPGEIRVFGSTSSPSQYGSINALVSSSTSYANQAGITMKGNSARGDDQSGEVSVFPDYASIGFANELGGGTISSRISAEVQQVGMSGPRVQLSCGVDTGNAGDGVIRLGVSNPSTGGYYQDTVLAFTGSGGTGNARITGTRNSGIQFDTNVVSITPGGSGLGPLQASNVTAPSTRAIKKDFAPLDFDPVAAVQAARPEMWRYLFERPGSLLHVGPMAEDLPAALVHPAGPESVPSLDVGSALGTVWAVAGILADRLDALEAAS